jgi:hypothetical protein
MYLCVNKLIGALYLPLNHSADDVYPDLCNYLMVDFRACSNRSIYVDSVLKKMFIHQSLGLVRDGMNDDEYGHKMLRVNIPLLYNILRVPHQLRNADNDFLEPRDRKDAAIELVWLSANPWPAYPDYISIAIKLPLNNGGVDLPDIILANRGISILWKPLPPPHQPIWETFFGVHGTELPGIVPITGPLLSASFCIAWNALTDSDSFVFDNPLALSFAVAGSVADSFKETRNLWGNDVVKGAQAQAATCRSSSSSSKGNDSAMRGLTTRAATVDEYARCLKVLRERDKRAGIGPSSAFAARVPNADVSRADNKQLAQKREERRACLAQTGPPPTAVRAQQQPRITDAMLSAYAALQKVYEESMNRSTDNAEMKQKIENTRVKPPADGTKQKVQEVEAQPDADKT